MADTRLEMTEEILNRVVYGMENQKERLYLNPSDGALESAGEDGRPPSGGIPMPPWGPSDGYRLMDGFAGTLSDHVLRSRLKDILVSGSGVFRRFKDALKDRPELERLWFHYKKRQMRRTAVSWLTRWSDALTLESLGPGPDDFDDLALSDFVVRAARPGEADAVAAWISEAEAEAMPNLSREERSGLLSAGTPECANLLIAEGPAGEIVGFARFILDDTGDSVPLGRLGPVYVRPGFRGLGLGKRLAGQAMDTLIDRGALRLNLITGGECLLKRLLERRGFEPAAVIWRKEP